MARPKKEINETLVLKLARIGCTVEEIASMCGCGKSLIEQRFQAAVKKGREGFKTSLRRQQFLAAKKGSIPMLIWLGKQYLGQSEPQTQQQSEGGTWNVTVEYVDVGTTDKAETLKPPTSDL